MNVCTVVNKWTLYVNCINFLSVLSKRPVNNLSFLVRTKEHRYTCIYTPNDKFDNCNYLYIITLTFASDTCIPQNAATMFMDYYEIT